MMKSIFLALTIFIAYPVQSCINEYRAKLNGEVVYSDAENMSPSERFDINDKPLLERKLSEAEKTYKSTGNIEDYSDLGAMYVYNQQYEKAKTIFLEIEAKSPGLYATAANLGTVYELLGQNELAYQWIQKAIKINPGSHHGSEWIHLKILEAKIQAKGSEKYLWTHSILHLDFGNAEIPVNKNKLDLVALKSQLYFQLNERMSFVKPKDPIVAQLLIDLGNIVALTTDATGGFQVYQKAREYGASSALFEKRYAYLDDLQSEADFANALNHWLEEFPGLTILVAGIVFLGVITGITLLFRSMIKKIRNRKAI